MITGEVWILVDGQRAYTLHFKDFATASKFCEDFRASTENEPAA